MKLVFATLMLSASAFGAERVERQAREVWKLQEDIKATAASLDGLATKVDGAVGSTGIITDGVKLAGSSLSRVDALVGDVSGISGKLDVTKAGLNKDLGAAQSSNNAAIAASKAELDTTLAALKRKVTSTLSTQKVQSDAALAEAVAKTTATTATLTTTLANYAKCAKNNQIYDGTACVNAEPKADSLMPRMFHRGWDNGDGRESGYISNRWVKVKKAHDDTHLRVTYYDNMRVHGHGGCHGNWNVMFCNAAGGDCQECSDPGRCNMNRYSSHQHGWWMNDHKSSTIECVCKRAGSRTLKAGSYQLKGYINKNGCDLETGHSSQFGSMIVQEVNKINSL